MKARTISVLVAVGVLASYGVYSWGQPDTPILEYYWEHPSEGAPISHYQAERMLINIDLGDTVIAFIDSIPFVESELGFQVVDYLWGYETRFRVRGIGIKVVNGDTISGRPGPFSEWSDSWIDYGPPNQPGIPQSTLGLR